MVKKVKRLPASENGRGTAYTAKSGNVYKITKHITKQKFYLWRVYPDAWYEKVIESDTPYELYATIDKLEGL